MSHNKTVHGHRTFRTGLAALALIFMSVAAARADVTDVMREVERNGSARVIITMRTGGNGHRGWNRSQSVEQQRATVDAAAPTFERRMAAANIPLIRRFHTLPFAGAVVDGRQLMNLATMPEVASIQLVRMQRKLPVPNTSGSESQQATSGSLASSVTSIDVPNAWAAGYQGQGYTVAVLDGGFNVNHPMLAGKNVGDACFADSDQTLHPECPSGTSPQIGAGAASHCPTESNGSNRCDHGSNVASIAVGNDGTNFGVARGAKLMPIDVFSSDTLSSDCKPDPAPCEVTDEIAILDALDYVNENAAAYNIAAVNLSVGGDSQSGYCDTDPRKTAIDNLRAKGIAVMIAAGNDGLNGQVEEPGCISTAETIGATDSSTNVASFSNFASSVDLMAPGSSITAASGTGSNMITMSGTSMATPHAAGAWAIMRSAFPNATADQIEQALKTTGIAVTRNGAGISVPKIQVMQAINYVGGHGRLLFNQIVSSNANALGYSFLRVYNSGGSTGTVTFTIRDASTGTTLGTWTSASVATHGAAQFFISDIEKNAVPAANQTITASDRSYYNLEVSSTFGGYLQYVLWSANAGVLGNLTSCPAGPSANRTTLMYVDAGSNSSYVSHIRIVNSGAVSGTATLNYSDLNGGSIGQWTSPVIAPGAALDVSEAQIEVATSALASATSAGAGWYNVTLSNFAGYAQHVIENRNVGVFTDVGAKCDITASGS